MQYAQLFDHLKTFRVVYVATKDNRFSWAERLFRRFVRALPSYQAASALPSNDRLLVYFQLEDAFRRKDFASLDMSKLDELKRLRIEFSGVQTERLLKVWQEAGKDDVLGYLNQNPKNTSSGEVHFSTCRLAWKKDALR